MRVLIVEDEFLVAIDLASIVESIGHEVVGPVQSARSAIDLARIRPVDVALLDVNLGTDTAAPVADVLDKQGVPYAIVTAYRREHLARRFQDTAHIPKPIRPADILAALKDLQSRLQTNALARRGTQS